MNLNLKPILDPNKGHIYVLTGPNGKQYVGQAVCYYKMKNDRYKKAGYILRWKKHIEESKKENKNGCTYLNNAINKYGYNKFQVVLFEETLIDKLNEREQFWIKHLNTVVPNGYNLNTGGGQGKRHSKETIEKIIHNNIGKNKGKNRIRKDRNREEDKNLPMYVISHHSGTQNGYGVKCHPVLKNKYFVSKSLSMEEKLKLAIDYLNSVQ